MATQVITKPNRSQKAKQSKISKINGQKHKSPKQIKKQMGNKQTLQGSTSVGQTKAFQAKNPCNQQNQHTQQNKAKP